MLIYRLQSLLDYQNYLRRCRHLLRLEEEERKQALSEIPPGASEFTLPGFSYPAGKMVDFTIRLAASTTSDHSGPVVNWREVLRCPETRMNARLRASVHVIESCLDLYGDSYFYIAEQVTPLFKYFKPRFDRLIGSEFLGDSVPLGHTNQRGVRNEDLCRLSFDSESLEAVLSFDVLEHVPDYASAIKESFRVLRPGGRLFWSAPVNLNSEDTVVRAVIENGEIKHLLPPQYHGDPISGDGVLCYQIFGWDVLDMMRETGFRDVCLMICHGQQFGYYKPNTFFYAIK